MRILLPFLCLLASGHGVVLVEGGRKVPERDLLRGYAFASCMEVAYKGTSVEHDAARVAELCREVGSTTRQEVYTALDEAAVAVAPARPALVDAANLAIMSCLEFYESPTLLKAIQEAGRRRPTPPGGSASPMRRDHIQTVPKIE